jgi:hypothetical protein
MGAVALAEEAVAWVRQLLDQARKAGLHLRSVGEDRL